MELQSQGITTFKDSVRVMMYSVMTLKDFKKLYISQVVFSYNFYSLYKSILILKKPSIFQRF